MSISKGKQLRIHKFTVILFITILINQYLDLFYQWSYILARHDIGVALIPGLILSLVVNAIILLSLYFKNEKGYYVALVLLGFGLIDIFFGKPANVIYFIVILPLIYNRNYYLTKK